MSDKDDKEKEIENEAPQMSESEQRARSNNWTPKEEWQGNEEDWVDHKEFNFRGELMGRINEQSGVLNTFKKKIEERDKALEDLKAIHAKTAEREYKKALKTLRDEKALAVREGDGDKVVEIEEEIDVLKEKKDALEKEDTAPPNVVPDTPAEIISWLGEPKNQWYNQNKFLRDVADTIARDIKTQADSQGQEISPTNLLRQMENRIQKELPQYFKKGASPVDDGDGNINERGGSKGKMPKLSDMPEEMQEVCKRLVKLKVMTEKEYIEEQVAAGAL